MVTGQPILAQAQSVQVLGIGTAALLGGDLTDPENDGNEAAGPFDPTWNWRAITSNNEPGFGGGEYAFNIFDNRVGGGNDKWCCDDATFTNPLWVNVEFRQPVSLTHFTMTSGDDDPTRDVRGFRIQGSNDGVDYTDIYVRQSATALWNQRNQVLKFTLAKPTPPYLHIRYLANDTTGALHQLNELEYFGTVVPLPFTAENRFNPTGAYLVFEQALDAATVVPGNFTIAGLEVISATLQGDGRTVVLATAVQIEGQTYALTVQGLQYAGGGPVSSNPITRRWTHGFGVQAHRITHDRWDGIAGTTTDVVTGLATYPQKPSFTVTLPRFEIPPDVADNYGGRLYGVFHPPTTGSYIFYISSDDQSQLFLSPDAVPANKVQIAREPNWNGSRQYIAGSNQASRGNPPANISAPIQLTQGQPVWLELLYKEGAGGDNASATARFPGGAAVVNGSAPLGEEHFAIRYRQGPDGTRFQSYGPVAITQPPSGTTVVEGAQVTLTAIGDGSPPHRWLWRRNGDVIPGVSGSTHTFSAIPGTDGSYTASLANDFSESTSAPAVVNVTFDTTPPTLATARGTEGRNRVRVQFSEPVDATAATALANYSLTGPDGPLAIRAAQLLDPSLVELLTAKQPEGALFTLTVNNVSDRSLAKNPIAPNSSAEFRAYVFIAGGVLHRRWNGVDSLAALTGLARFPNQPDEVTLEPLPEYPANGGNEAGTGYGNLLTFWWTPEETGDYEFFISADDQAELWLSTDDDPANKKRIAIEPQWHNPRQWTSTLRRNAVAPENRSTTYQASQWPGGPGPIHLEAGKRYFIEAVHAEGSGGDNVGVNVRRVPKSPAKATPTQVDNGDAPNLPADEVGILVPFDDTSMRIAGQPAPSLTLIQGRTGTLSVDVKASLRVGGTSLDLPRRLQWQCAEPGTENWVDVSGANSESFRVGPFSVADSGRRYRLFTWIGGSIAGTQVVRELTSDVVTVTVLPDTSHPAIASVVALSPSSIQVTCTEGLSGLPRCSLSSVLDGVPIPITGVTAGANPDQFVFDLGQPLPFESWLLLDAISLCDSFNNCGADEFCLQLSNPGGFPADLGALTPDAWLRFNRESGWLTMPNTGGSGNNHFGESKAGATLGTAQTLPHTGGAGPLLGDGLANRAFLGTGTGGNQALVVLNGPPIINAPTEFTILLWAKLDRTRSAFAANPLFGIPGVARAGMHQLFPNGDGPPALFLSFNEEGFRFVDIDYPYDGAWHFLAFVAGRQGLQVYMDGVLVGTSTTSIPTNWGQQTAPLTIGYEARDGTHSHFDGCIDEVVIFGNRALNAETITGLYTSTRPPSAGEPPLVSGSSELNCELGQTCTANILVTDPDTAPGDRKLAAHADNPSIIPDTNIILGGSVDNRTISLTPVASGTTVVHVRAFDGSGVGDLPIRVTVSGNRPPVARGDFVPAEIFYGTAFGNVIRDNGTGADSDPDGDPINVTPATVTTAHGTVSIAGDGNFGYTPKDAGQFPAADNFTYELRDSRGGATTASVTIIPILERLEVVEDVAVAFGLGGETAGNAFAATVIESPGAGAVTPGDTPYRFIYTPQANASGTDRITYAVAGAGFSTPLIQLLINVIGVNDAPAFVMGPNLTVKDNAGPQTVPGQAKDIMPGPAGEQDQTVAFQTSNDNNGLFAVQPAIAPDGTLTFTPAPGTAGTATVTVVARDNGGTANGGQDSSAPQTFQITVQPLQSDLGLSLHPSATDLLGATPTVVAVEIVNRGDHPAKDVQLTVLTEKEVSVGCSGDPHCTTVSSHILKIDGGEIPAGGTRTFTVAAQATGVDNGRGRIWCHVSTTSLDIDLKNNKAGFLFNLTGQTPQIPQYPIVEVSQTTLDLDDGVRLFTDVGLVEISFLPTATPLYFNASIDGEWSLRNVPLFQGGPNDGQPVKRVLTTKIRENPDGTLTIMMSYSITDEPVFVYVPEEKPMEVARRLNCANSGHLGHSLFYQPSPAIVVGDEVVEYATHPGTFPNQPQAGPVCVPAAVSNSLNWLNDHFDLGLDPAELTIEKMKQATGWRAPDPNNPDPAKRPGGSANILATREGKEWWLDLKHRYMTQKGLGIASGHTFSPQVAMEELRKGHDVEIDVGGHTAAVVALGRLKSGKFIVEVAHDIYQDGQASGAQVIEGGILLDPTTGMLLSGTPWFNQKPFLNFVIEKPINVRPVVPDESRATLEDTTVGGELSATDHEGDPLEYRVTKPPQHGSLELNPKAGFWTYTPNADYYGPDAFEFVANDGKADSRPGQVTLTVRPVNDPPRVELGLIHPELGETVTVAEDSGSHRLEDFADSVSGPENEAAQTVTYRVSVVDGGDRFVGPPTIAPDGTFTFELLPNVSGNFRVRVEAMDSGDGQNTSAPKEFNLVVTPVNDPPTFNRGLDQVVSADAGPQTVPGWVTGIDPGPNEPGQGIRFDVTTNEEELFLQAPAVSGTGTLTYTPAPGKAGKAIFTITVKDDGGTANGGVDTSAPVTAEITVAPEPIQVFEGLLLTNEELPSPGNEDIPAWEFAQMLDQYLDDGAKGDGQVDANIFGIFALCFGGDFLAYLNDTTGEGSAGEMLDRVRFTNATLHSANAAGEITWSDGAGPGMISVTRPGEVSMIIDAAAVSSAVTDVLVDEVTKERRTVAEKPGSVGSLLRKVGGASSTHVLVWAGLPELRHERMTQKIIDQFAGHPNTTIDVLSGQRAPGGFDLKGTPVTFGPATRNNLRAVLEKLGALMKAGPDEQFVFFGIDHGGSNVRAVHLPEVPAGADAVLPVVIPPQAHQAYSFADASPLGFTLVLPETVPNPQKSQYRITVNGHEVGTLQDAAQVPGTQPDGAPAQQYRFTVPAEWLVPPGAGGFSQQSIRLSNRTETGLDLSSIQLYLGPMPEAERYLIAVPRLVGGVLEFEVPVGSILQRADVVVGPWTDLSNSTGLVKMPALDAAAYFRLLRSP